MFRGASQITLDSKGRMAVPSRYRERIVNHAQGQLVSAPDRIGCLLIYPLPDWKEIEAKVMSLSNFNTTVRTLQEVMVGQSGDMQMDAHGRILIPRMLREFARLDRHVILLGQGKRFELWDEERWNRRRDEWLAGDDDEDLPDVLESLSL